MIKAAELLVVAPPHPLRGAFLAWCKAKDQPPTKRQASKFLNSTTGALFTAVSKVA